MSLTQLQTPFLEGGIRSTNFFNGRLLSGEAMTTEQAAVIEHACRLGQTVGSGVALGLEIQLNTAPASASSSAPAGPVLTVSAGLAINRCGQVMKLLQPVDVTLVRQPAGAGVATKAKTFGSCQPPTSGGRLTGDGVYIFTIAPASAQEGRAAVNGLSADSARCNSQNLVECVQFNLVPIPQVSPYLTADDFAQVNLPFLRNRIAYRCFGVSPLATYLQDPFNTYLHEYGVVDALRSSGVLSPAEVPLALAYWTGTDGIKFVDMWSVRRRIIRHSSAGGFFPLITDRRTAEAEAMFLQFQDQVSYILAHETNLSAIQATDRFDFLPPVGVVPLAGGGFSTGFDLAKFFAGLSVCPMLFLEGSRLRHLVQRSLAYPAVNLASEEFLWQYTVRENAQTLAGSGVQPAQPCMLFASGQLAYFSEPRFDVARWNYSNYSIS
jgi:hypothetical protein